jgi:hypothetical protein
VATETLPELGDECFFIAPIGAEGSDVRERSDGVLEYIVAPAATAVGLTTIRADKIAKPGEITRQVIEHVVGARASVVDLTDANPNVYYEMAVRHTAQLPTVLIAQEGEILPFDIAQMRTIFFDHTSLKSAAECREQITQYLSEALSGEVDSPISSSVRVQRLEQGSPQDRVLAQIIDGLDELRGDVSRMSSRSHRAQELADFEVPIHVGAIEDLTRELVESSRANRNYKRLLRRIAPPLRYMLQTANERDIDQSRYGSIVDLMEAVERELAPPRSTSDDGNESA